MECAWAYGPGFWEAFDMVMKAHDRAELETGRVAVMLAACAIENRSRVSPHWKARFLEVKAKEERAWETFQRFREMMPGNVSASAAN